MILSSDVLMIDYNQSSVGCAVQLRQSITMGFSESVNRLINMMYNEMEIAFLYVSNFFAN